MTKNITSITSKDFECKLCEFICYKKGDYNDILILQNIKKL